MEKESKEPIIQKEIHPILSTPDFKDFIERRKIKEEDYEKLSKLLSIIKSWEWFEKDLVFDFHNFWTLYKEQSAEELEKMKEYPKRPKNWNEFVDTLISLEKDYGWTTLYHLQGVLEDCYRKL